MSEKGNSKYDSIDKKTLEEFRKQRDETELSISKLIDLKFKGYKVVKFKEVEENV